MRNTATASVVTAGIVAALLFALRPAGATEIRFVAEPTDEADRIIDTRTPALCERASLPGARCLSARDLLGPHNRLANFSGLLWLLGTAGLTGKEHVLVVGGPALERDFVAGLLYLAGQRRVSVLTSDISDGAKGGVTPQPGSARSTTREAVFTAPMRSDAAVLRSELLGEIRSATPPVILDGRREQAYWGRAVRAARGGHLPGAQHSPLTDWAASAAEPPVHVPEGVRPVVYGQDARDGLAFLARAVARGIDARVYLEGWAGWASDGALPADAATHPARRARESTPAATGTPVAQGKAAWGHAAGLALAGLALAGAGFLLGRRTAPRAES